MNRMQGLFSLAVLNMSRTRLAPTPTNIWMNSDPEIEKNGTPASPATARASKVLPVPGGPLSRTPLGIRPPSLWNFSGLLRNSTISWSSALAFSRPATSSNVVRCLDLSCRLAGLLTKLPRMPPSNWSRARRIIR